MAISKTQLFATIKGKSAQYSNVLFCENFAEENDKIITEMTAYVVKNNATNEHKLSMKLNGELNIVELSNGQIQRLRKAPKTGEISIHSDHIKVAGVRIDKIDIDPMTIREDSFSTVHGSVIKFW